jgi:hypothetical protein
MLCSGEAVYGPRGDPPRGFCPQLCEPSSLPCPAQVRHLHRRGDSSVCGVDTSAHAQPYLVQPQPVQSNPNQTQLSSKQEMCI